MTIAKRRFAEICALAAAFAAAGALRAGEDDPYIESDGTTGFDVGYRMTWDSRVEVDFALTTTEQAVNARLFGADFSHSFLGLSYSVMTKANGDDLVWVCHAGDGENYVTPWPKYETPPESAGKYLSLDTARHRFVFDMRDGVVRFTTGSVTNSSCDLLSSGSLTPNDNVCAHSLSLFAVYSNQSATKFANPVKARIYGVKVYEGETLIHDFVPCVNNGRVGFKDVVSGGFFCSKSSYSCFSAGGRYLTEGVSIAFSGTDYATEKLFIDTGWFATANTRVELDFTLLALPGSAAAGWLFSGSGDGGTFGVCVKKNGEGFMVHNGAGWLTRGALANVADVMAGCRTAIIDYPADKFAIKSGTSVVYGPVSANAAPGKTYSANTLKIGSNAAGTGEFAPIKVYGLRIYESGELVRDFAPCWRDGSVGMRDSRTGAFATYTGPLDARLASEGEGMPAEANPYVETDRALGQYVNTGYVPTSATRFELDYALTENRAANGTWYLFGGLNGKGFQTYDNKNGYGIFNSGWTQGVFQVAAADATLVRRTAFIDNVSGTGGLLTGCATNNAVASPSGQGETAAAGAKPIVVSANYETNTTYAASMRIYGFRIYEGGTLAHDYKPAEKGGAVGFQDGKSDAFLTVDAGGGPSASVAYGGVFPVAIQGKALVKCTYSKGATLVARAPGAVSYRWFMNGELVEGGTNGSLHVEWRKTADSDEEDEFRAVACFEMDGMTVEGDSSGPVEVVYPRVGFALVIQ